MLVCVEHVVGMVALLCDCAAALAEAVGNPTATLQQHINALHHAVAAIQPEVPRVQPCCTSFVRNDQMLMLAWYA